MNLDSSAAAGLQRLLWISIYRPALFARVFGSMNETFLFDTMDGEFDWFLENSRDGFSGEHPIFHLSFLIVGKFGVAKKSSLLSNDQTRHLFDVGSIIYSIFHSHKTTDLNSAV